MKALRLSNALRSFLLPLSIGIAVMSLVSCGGGGDGDDGKGGTRTGSGESSRQSADEFRYPDRPSEPNEPSAGGSGYPDSASNPGTGTGCTADALNESKYAAITYGMLLSDVQSIIGCQPFDSDPNATVWLSEEYLGAQLVVRVDDSQNIISKSYQGASISVPASMPTAVAQTCTSAHINQSKFDAIADDMTPDAVNQLIGCQPSRIARITDYQANLAETAYDWLIPVENQPNPDQLITVGFDDATGLSIFKTPQGF